MRKGLKRKTHQNLSSLICVEFCPYLGSNHRHHDLKASALRPRPNSLQHINILYVFVQETIESFWENCHKDVIWTLIAIVYSFSSDPEGVQKNYQRVLKFLPQIFGSETSDRINNFFIGPLAPKISEYTMEIRIRKMLVQRSLKVN